MSLLPIHPLQEKRDNESRMINPDCMTSNADYQQRIANYERPRLLDLWTQIQAGDTPEWESGKALEYLVLRAFELEGANVTYPYTIQMGGTILEQLDGAIYCDGFACLVECKDQNDKIAIDPVAKLRNQLLRRPAGVIGLIFTTTQFTQSTQILAQYNANQAILLWEGSEIEYALQHQWLRLGLTQKYRYCVERAAANYRIDLRELP